MNKHQRKSYYLSILPVIREVARSCGYAIGVHGSMTRDMDLIAIPWTEKALLRTTLVKRICKAVDGLEVDSWNTAKPRGRHAHTILLKRGLTSKIDGKVWSIFIDLSVMG